LIVPSDLPSLHADGDRKMIPRCAQAAPGLLLLPRVMMLTGSLRLYKHCPAPSMASCEQMRPSLRPMGTLQQLLTRARAEDQLDVLCSCLSFPKTKSLGEAHPHTYVTIEQVLSLSLRK
jgi:hypothetical protein